MKLPWSQEPKEAPASADVASARASDELIIYGTAWCGDCHRTRRFLDQHQISYHWIDADAHPEANAIIQQVNHGRRAVPTLIFPDGTTLTEPSNPELARKLSLDTPSRVG